MDRRRLLLILAVFVALLGTALVFVYVKSVQKNATATTDVLVATANIATGDNLQTAVNQGKIALQPVDNDTLSNMPGYQTSTAVLDKTFATTDLFQGQVIVQGQYSKNPDTGPAPTSLPIPPGMIAISVNLTDPDRVAGNIENGSQVAIFVTGALQGGTAGAASASSTDSTRLLLPKVTVLNVGSPQPAVTSTTTDQNGTQTTEQLPRTLLTIAVTQKEAQKVILSSKALTLTFGLLTNQSKVHPAPGTSTDASLFR